MTRNGDEVAHWRDEVAHRRYVLIHWDMRRLVGDAVYMYIVQ